MGAAWKVKYPPPEAYGRRYETCQVLGCGKPSVVAVDNPMDWMLPKIWVCAVHRWHTLWWHRGKVDSRGLSPTGRYLFKKFGDKIFEIVDGDT